MEESNGLKGQALSVLLMGACDRSLGSVTPPTTRLWWEGGVGEEGGLEEKDLHYSRRLQHKGHITDSNSCPLRWYFFPLNVILKAEKTAIYTSEIHLWELCCLQKICFSVHPVPRFTKLCPTALPCLAEEGTWSFFEVSLLLTGLLLNPTLWLDSERRSNPLIGTLKGHQHYVS